MTFKIILAIHYEAFKLWVKGIKFIKKILKLRIILRLRIDDFTYIADKIVFSILNKVVYGYIEITTFSGQILKFCN